MQRKSVNNNNKLFKGNSISINIICDTHVALGSNVHIGERRLGNIEYEF